MQNWKTEIGRLRILGKMEGVSFLLLMGIAMPLKYFAGLPVAVKYTGWAHGLLFIFYCLAILLALTNGKISFGKSVLAFFAAFIPFGPFLIDPKIAADDKPSG
jgi:integral membrane protein